MFLLVTQSPTWFSVLEPIYCIYISLPGWTSSYIFGYLNAKFQVLKSIGCYSGLLHTGFYCITIFPLKIVEHTDYKFRKIFGLVAMTSPVSHSTSLVLFITALFQACSTGENRFSIDGCHSRVRCYTRISISTHFW